MFYKAELLVLHLTPTWRTRVLFSFPLEQFGIIKPSWSISSSHHRSSGQNGMQASLPRAQHQGRENLLTLLKCFKAFHSAFGLSISESKTIESYIM